MERSVSIEQLLELVQQAADKARTNEYRYILETQINFYKMGMERVQPEDWKLHIPPLTDDEIKCINHPIQFEYCECGCKCSSGRSKGIEYSISDSLKGKTPFRVYRGHGRIFGKQIGGPFSSFKDAAKAAQDDFDKIP